jgi:Protein of unknown function (DUF3108)
VRTLALVLLAACGNSHATSSVPQAPPVAAKGLPDGPPLLTPGERMSYRLALGDVDLATYDVAVGDITEVAGRQAIGVQGHAKAVGFVSHVANIDDVFTSWIDVKTGRPLLWTVDEYATKGTDKERTEARIAEREGDMVPISFHVNDDDPKPEPQKVSMTDVWDYNAFTVAVRSWDAPVGSTVSTEVFRSRFLWHVDLKVHSRENVSTDLGDLPAIRIDGRTYKLGRDGKRFPNTEERIFTLWISDDDGRVPLRNDARTDYGDVKMTITEYNPGTGTRLRN